MICLFSVYYRVFSLSSLDEDGMSSVTMWIIGDLEKASGRKLLLNALKHVVGFSTSFPHSILPWLNLCSRGQYITSLKFFQGMNADSINAIFHIGLSLTQILHLVSLQLQNLSAVNPWSTFRQRRWITLRWFRYWLWIQAPLFLLPVTNSVYSGK